MIGTDQNSDTKKAALKRLDFILLGAKAGLKSSCKIIKNKQKIRTTLQSAPFYAPTIYFDSFKLN